MASFTVRVELHHEHDYAVLHEAMENEGFSRTITSRKGTTHHLPTAEYVLNGEFTPAQVMTKTKRAAKKTGKGFSVLLTEARRHVWCNLPEVD